MRKLQFRQALMHAINRDHLIQDLGGPTLNPPLTQVLPKEIVGGEQTIDLYPYDVAKAKALLSEAGVSGTVPLKVLYDPAIEGIKKNLATLQQDLKEVGITVTGVPAPTADIFSKYLPEPSVAERGVWDVSFAGWGPDWFGNAALSYFKPLFSGKSSFPPNGSNFGLLRQRGDQHPHREGRRREDRGRGRSAVAPGRRAGDEGRGLLPGKQPAAAQLPRQACAQRPVRLRDPELRSGQRLARPADQRRLTGSVPTPSRCPSSTYATCPCPSTRRTASCRRCVASRSRWSQGRTLGIVGESGSGKSVAVQTVVGLTRDARVSRRGLVRRPRPAALIAGVIAAHPRPAGRDDLPGLPDQPASVLPGGLADRRTHPGARPMTSLGPRRAGGRQTC